jgi:hypothetical protein
MVILSSPPHAMLISCTRQGHSRAACFLQFHISPDGTEDVVHLSGNQTISLDPNSLYSFARGHRSHRYLSIQHLYLVFSQMAAEQ